MRIVGIVAENVVKKLCFWGNKLIFVRKSPVFSLIYRCKYLFVSYLF